MEKTMSSLEEEGRKYPVLYTVEVRRTYRGGHRKGEIDIMRSEVRCNSAAAVNYTDEITRTYPDGRVEVLPPKMVDGMHYVLNLDNKVT